MQHSAYQKILSVGAANRNKLHGVLAGHRDGVGDTVVVILNSGLIHHVGACRLSVKLASLLSEKGIASFRFDHSGVGDSASRPGSEQFLDRAKNEVMEVCDALEQRFGVKKFILFGLCSGANTALYTSVFDSRIVGIAQIDPDVFRTPRWYLQDALSRCRNPLGLLRSIAGKIGFGGRDQKSSDNKTIDDSFDWGESLSRQQLAAAYAALIKRKATLFVLSTGKRTELYNYERQFIDVFSTVDFGSQLTYLYLPDAEHILPERHSQQLALAEISAWMRASVFD